MKFSADDDYTFTHNPILAILRISVLRDEYEAIPDVDRGLRLCVERPPDPPENPARDPPPFRDRYLERLCETVCRIKVRARRSGKPVNPRPA